jgi:type II secretory pathway pseudopilin PulG
MSDAQVVWGIGIVAAIALVGWLLSSSRAREQAALETQRARQQAEQEQRTKEEADSVTKAREFRKSATRMRARVRFMYQSGMVNLLPNLHLTLTVEAPDGPYDVEVEHHVENIDLPRFAEGSTIDVYVDPEDRKHVVVR